MGHYRNRKYEVDFSGFLCHEAIWISGQVGMQFQCFCGVLLWCRGKVTALHPVVIGLISGREDWCHPRIQGIWVATDV